MRYDIVDPTGIDRLFRLIEQRAGHWLAMQVEQGKIELTEQQRFAIDFQRIEPDLRVELNRQGFESAIAALLERIGASIKQLLADAGVRAEEVDTVFFTGGSSAIPALRDSVAGCCRGRAMSRATASAASAAVGHRGAQALRLSRAATSFADTKLHTDGSTSGAGCGSH